MAAGPTESAGGPPAAAGRAHTWETEDAVGRTRWSIGAGTLAACLAIGAIGAAQAGAHAMSFPITNITVPESAGTATITVNRTGSGTTPWVDFTTEDGTAVAGADYQATSGRITFGPNEQQRTFTVPITDDPFLEGDETVTLRLTAAGPAGDGHLGSPTVATLTIVDDDSFSAFKVASSVVNESAGTATIEVLRSGHLGATDSVGYATSDGTATAGADYTAASGTLTFAPNEVSKSFTVAITDDTVADEGQESVNLALSSPSAPNHHLGSPSTAVLYIDDNEAPTGPIDPTPTLTAPTAPSTDAAGPGPPVVLAASAQAAARSGGVALTAGCEQACRLSATGHVTVAGRRYALRGVRRQVRAGGRTALRLALPAAARAAVRRALRNGRPVTARVRIVSRTGSGATRSAVRAIRLTG